MSSRPPLLDALARRPLLLDAGMGVRLMGRGLDLDRDDPALWNLTHPVAIREVHEADVKAGSDALVTNTFGANATWLARHGRAGDMTGINARAVAIAREAAGPGRYLVGSIGPTAATADAYLSQAEALADAGVDALLLETHDPDQALLGLAALRATTPLPMVVGLAILPADLGAAVRRIEDAGAVAVGVNCMSPEDASRAILAMREATRLPLLHKPGAMAPGTPTVSPADFASAVAGLLRLGVRLLGGCCGATEAHVAALRSALDAAGRPGVG